MQSPPPAPLLSDDLPPPPPEASSAVPASPVAITDGASLALSFNDHLPSVMSSSPRSDPCTLSLAPDLQPPVMMMPDHLSPPELPAGWPMPDHESPPQLPAGSHIFDQLLLRTDEDDAAARSMVAGIRADEEDYTQNSLAEAQVEGALLNYEDFSSHFTTDQAFEDRDELLEWAKNIGKTLGMVLNIRKSDTCSRSPRVQIGCERGGKYRKKKSPEESVDGKIKKVRKSGSKKCECPFLLRGSCMGDSRKWQVYVACGQHNHPLAACPEGHSFAGRLTEEERSMVVQLTNNGMRPTDVLNVLKQHNPENASTVKHLYNTRRELKRIETGERSQLQQLMTLLNDSEYMHWSSRHETSEVVKNVFFAHPQSIKLFKCFPYLLLMDASYKTNMYKWTLFQIVGITSTLNTFSVCFALFEEDNEDNFAWALEKFSSLLEKDELPHVVVTDWDLSLMNAAKKIFPEATQLLRRRHVAKDVLAYSKREFSTQEVWEKFNSMWSALAASPSVEAYERNLKALEADFEAFPEALEYVKRTWLDSYKEMFVASWTDCHLHFGTITTSRVESAHSRLKSALKTTRNDFLSLWKVLHPQVSLQMVAIKASFEKSLNVVRHEQRLGCYKELRGFISKEGLDLIVNEKKSSDIGIALEACDHYLQRTHGLPCVHLLVEYENEGRAIPLSIIHPFWKKLSCEPLRKAQCMLECHPEFLIFAECFERSDPHIQRYLLKRLKDLATPSASWLVDPLEKVKRRGRPKGSKREISQIQSSTRKDNPSEHVQAIQDSTGTSENMQPQQQPKKRPKRASKAEVALKQALPPEFVPYIEDITDVRADGHCGFSVVALALGKAGWAEVRQDLLLEMKNGREIYTYLFGGESKWTSIYSAIDCQEATCSKPNWMCIPEMGHLVASRYDVVVVYISKEQCLTFLPLTSSPNPTKAPTVIALGYVNNCHFVHLQLSKGCPIPPLATLWGKCRAPVANGWMSPFEEQMNLWNQIMPPEIPTRDVHDLDD